MRSNSSLRYCRRSNERGYAMILAVCLTAAMLVASTAIIANLRIEGKRQREAEAIWRGNQYARAIKLYYHKTGHYPQTIEDLQKGLPQLHFLRQAYKDPMNTTDGAWRFIYVNAAGQLIGSTKYTSLQQMAYYDSGGTLGGMPGQMPGLVGTPVSSLTNSSGFGGVNSTSSQTAGQAPPSLDPNAPPQNQNSDPNQNRNQQQQGEQSQQEGQPSAQQGQQPGAPGPGAASPGAGQSPFTTLNGTPNGQPTNPADLQKPTGPVDGPVLGAFLTGVASKMDVPSQKVYKRGKKYIQWEFIWNPLEEAAANMQQALNPQGQQPGIGQPIGQGGNPTSGFGVANPFGGSTLPNQNPTPPSNPMQP